MTPLTTTDTAVVWFRRDLRLADQPTRYVGELAGIDGKRVHRPWELPNGPPLGYPAPMVDHAVERNVALAHYDEVRAR